MISKGSCETEDFSNNAENSKMKNITVFWANKCSLNLKNK